MKKLWLSEKMISHSFWRVLRSSIYYAQAKKEAQLISEVTGPLVDKFSSVAGSISLESTKMLWLLARYFSPKIVGEIGTYIGRSTLAISFGGINSVEKIFTCDGTFDELDLKVIQQNLPNSEKVSSIEKINYFGKTMSTDMLTKVKEQGNEIDFLFLDGRISPKDCELLVETTSSDCVILVDDFEGVEKGVSNVFMLRSVFKGHLLIEPEVLEGFDRGNLAVLVPSSILSLSRQQTLPVNM